MKRRDFVSRASGLAAVWSGALALPAAASTFPQKPVRLVTPFAPGQGSDILARVLGERLTRKWGQSVYVENRSGANGSLALREASRNGDGGHTLLITSNSPVVINPSLYKDLSYDVGRDLKPLLLLSTTDVALFATSGLPARNLDELIALLKKEPGKYSYGSIGTGSTSHLAMETFKRAAGVDLVHVPYRGSSLAMTDLIAGNVQLMFDGLPSSLPHAKAGRIRALAVSGPRDSRFLPGVPGLGRAGLAGTPPGGWYGALASSSIDDALAARLNADLRAVLQEPGIAEKLTELAMDPVEPMSNAQFAAFIDKEQRYWKDVTQSLGIYQSA
jgi:tripartite-type tricarboxylate transporter receptor subunit TctC